MSLSTELQKYTYAQLMQIALAQASDNVSKREGSFIYDGAALACYVLAEAYQFMYQILQETYVITASGEYLDRRVMEMGISRREATAAVMRADFVDKEGNPAFVPIGSRWSTLSTSNPLNYVVIAEYQNPGTSNPPKATAVFVESAEPHPGTSGFTLDAATFLADLDSSGFSYPVNVVCFVAEEGSAEGEENPSRASITLMLEDVQLSQVYTVSQWTGKVEFSQSGFSFEFDTAFESEYVDAKVLGVIDKQFSTREVVVVEGGAVPGAYQLRCETPGVVGQEYTGPIIPLTYLAGTITATMSTTLVPGRDTETDDDLRERYLERVNYRAFGGNIAQYREWLAEIPGIGACQIYPVWNGGGTVKCSIVDSTYRACTEEFVNKVQEDMDPRDPTLSGIGIGIAPIDHRVTVTTPEEVQIDISATITIGTEEVASQYTSAVEAAIEAYLAELRHDWGKSDQLNHYRTEIFVARITVAILSVSGIQNVTNVKLNNTAADVVLQENETTQQIPILGEVILNAAS